MAAANSGDGGRAGQLEDRGGDASIRFHMNGRSRPWTAPSPPPVGRRAPGEQVHEDPRVVRQRRLGQPDRRDAEQRVGEEPRCRRRSCARPVVRQRSGGSSAVRRTPPRRPAAPSSANAGPNSRASSSVVPISRSTPGGRAGGDGVQRPARQHVAARGRQAGDPGGEAHQVRPHAARRRGRRRMSRSTSREAASSAAPSTSASAASSSRSTPSRRSTSRAVTCGGLGRHVERRRAALQDRPAEQTAAHAARRAARRRCARRPTRRRP